MARNRVSSFLSTWSISNIGSSHHPPPHSPEPSADAPPSPDAALPLKQDPASATQVSSSGNLQDSSNTPSPTPQRTRAASGRSRSSSRPASMVQTYQPPLMEVANDTPPELQPIFTFLNSHSNKLYQEGYFLKLHDLDARGRPSTDRTWLECFAQLVGTVLSLWDAAELDAAGEDGEVVPTFINLADASIKMIESLPMDEKAGQALQNVLSISTAANNRYLLHFNTLNSLTQWTAGIRLSMYEHATLQEAYTGSLIAGKGKQLNNIRPIMERSKFKYEDWARVRFGAGTPWRRCWFVISPPDEKEYQKMQKQLKKKNPYDKTPILKGDLKFYESRKINKRSRPIATITNAYSAYAIYPQSKPLIDQSTLVKVEGKITIHSSPESVTEGFVFVMPEVHPAVSGFEMMLRFLFPVWDTFNLYGRPNRLIADVLDQRGLMFAMPKDRRYGYLEILDVAGLIHTEGSVGWPERQWRKQMKELTSKRMLAIAEGGDIPRHRKSASRTSLPSSRSNTLRFDDSPSGRSTPQGYGTSRRAETQTDALHHRRSASEAPGFRNQLHDTPSRLGQSPTTYGDESPPPRPPPHREQLSGDKPGSAHTDTGSEGGQDTPSPDRTVPPEVQAMASRSPPPGPVGPPPTFAHYSNQRPRPRPNQAPELRRGHSDLDQATLTQMAEATSGRKDISEQEQYGSSGSDLYGPPLSNGYQGGYGNGYSAAAGQRGYPDVKAGGMPADYQQQGMMNSKSRPGMTRLATIPASPFIEQTSPILERAGQIQGENPSSVSQSAAAAALGISKPGPYSQSHPDVRKDASSSDPALAQRSPPAEKPKLERAGTSFSVSRKPLRNSQELSEPKRPDHPQQQPQQQQQWNPQQYQYNQQQRQQQGGYGYNSYTPPQQQKQQYPQNPASGGAEIPPQQRRDQSPYAPQGGRNSPYHQMQPGAQSQPMHHGGMHIPTGRTRPPMQQGGSYGPPPMQEQQQGGPYPGPQQQMQGSPPQQQQDTQQGPRRWI